jgi:parallel beta-helix repeat protein
MKCPDCGTELPTGSNFCGTCGAPVLPQPAFDPDPTATMVAKTRIGSPAVAGQLTVESGAGVGKQFPLQGTQRIGRTKDNEIVLADTQASRHHAAISQEASGYSLQDLNSTNGTFLNEQRITSPQNLKDGDRIRIGSTTLVFGWQPISATAPAPFTRSAQPTMTAPGQYPPQEESTRRPTGVPTIAIAISMVLGVALCVAAAVGLYLFLGRSGPDQASLSAGQAPAFITQVVTNTPAQVMTAVITSPPEPTTTRPPTVTPIPEPVTARIAPDGSGDYASLEVAAHSVPSSSTIVLDPGIHHLTGSLEITKSLSLQGAGLDQTTVAGSRGDQVVLFTGPGSFALQGITFRYEGTGPARVVTIDNGEIDIVRCRFSGGMRSEAESMGGDGILLWGSTSGSIRESHFEGNENSGLELQGQSQLLLEDNVVRDNGKSGLIYFDDSGGTARGNELAGNGLHGIEVRERAQPALEDNTCTKNAENGIAYFETASGSARRNTCSENGLHGIGVRENAVPILEDNVCTHNEETGIRFADSARGTARRNECAGNGYHGISVRDEAKPVLEGNNCIKNAESGIVYFEQASGTARQNTSAENGLHGISVNEQAHPTLEDNICENNAEAGIRFSDSSGGTARGNTCTGNQLHGFHLGEHANPTLEDNISNHNVQGGFVYFDEAGGVARGNECIGNQWGIHVAETASPELVDNDCRDNSQADVDDRRVPPEPSFGPVTFARDRTEENDPIDPTTTFPGGTKEVHALFDYDGMSSDVEWGRTWVRDGEEQVAKTQNWTGGESGTWGLRYFNTESSPLKPGGYELRLYIQGNLVQSGSFVIQE